MLTREALNREDSMLEIIIFENVEKVSKDTNVLEWLKSFYNLKNISAVELVIDGKKITDVLELPETFEDITTFRIFEYNKLG